MSANSSAIPPSKVSVGELLRQWRVLRGKSQLDLALDTGISQKHVSFVETGRSTPSRQMVIDLADALRVPLRDRNDFMLAAGYAPVYRQEPPDALPAQSVGRAIRRMLQQHEPFPAIVLDRYWNVLETNRSAPAFFGKFIDLSQRPRPRNLLHLMFDPAGMRPHLADFHETARGLLRRVQREAVGHVIDERTRNLLAELTSYPDVPTDLAAVAPDATLPIVPIRFRAGKTVLPLFSLITTVGTPQTIAAEEIRLESMFPIDNDAENAYLDFMREG
ncbi:MAG: helix-turn-helix transcriptional regulator [Rhizobiaceae bacterium]|nr:helix-turn-helix transcriptional regulator [Rhizobiaceae bacterium]